MISIPLLVMKWEALTDMKEKTNLQTYISSWTFKTHSSVTNKDVKLIFINISTCRLFSSHLKFVGLILSLQYGGWGYIVLKLAQLQPFKSPQVKKWFFLPFQ